MVDVFKILAKVKSLSLHSTSRSQSGWQAQGAGSLCVEQVSEDALIFNETGTSQLSDGRSLKFSNVYRWTKLTEDRLRLEHLRQGPDRPYHLFDLHRINEGNWSSSSPHLCGDDTYFATLVVISEDVVELEWEIKGTHKDEKVSCRYLNP